MSPPVRRPAFLAAVSAETEARPASFGGVRPPVPLHRTAPPAPIAAPEPPPAGPSAEELAALRAEAMEKVSHAVEVLRLQAERLAEQARSDALEIGFEVARRILEAELATGPEPLFALVRGALKRVGESRRVELRLHPEDARLVEARGAGALGLATSAVVIVPDAALDRGDCVIDTDFGRVDGRLRTRLDELHRAARRAAEEGVA